MTGMIELADKSIKIMIVNLVHIYINIMRYEIEDIKKKKLEHPEIKSTVN